jgi:hypothetical protein
MRINADEMAVESLCEFPSVFQLSIRIGRLAKKYCVAGLGTACHGASVGAVCGNDSPIIKLNVGKKTLVSFY